MIDHQVHVNARDLIEMEKAGFADVIGEARCTCRQGTGRPLLAKFYAAPDDGGTPRLWAWLPSRKAAGKEKVRALAVPIPVNAGELAWTQVSQCARCNATWLVLPGGIPDELAPGAHIAIGANRPATSTWAQDDPLETSVVTSDVLAGPAELKMVRVSVPTWGVVSSGDTPTEDSTAQ